MITDLSKAEQKIVDEASSTVTYLGFSDFNVKTSEPKWIIMKITATNANEPQGVVTYKYATGCMNQTNIWDDRASLTYYS